MLGLRIQLSIVASVLARESKKNTTAKSENLQTFGAIISSNWDHQNYHSSGSLKFKSGKICFHSAQTLVVLPLTGPNYGVDLTFGSLIPKIFMTSQLLFI